MKFLFNFLIISDQSNQSNQSNPSNPSNPSDPNVNSQVSLRKMESYG